VTTLAWLGLVGASTACSSRESQGATDLTALGDQTFGDICARCHGQDGRGGLPLTAGGPRPRDFADSTWQGSRTDAELVAIIRAGKPPMPAFGTLLSPSQLDAVVAKIRRIGREARK